MSIFKSITDTIKKYGNNVKIISNENSFLTNAFIEPLRYKNRIYVGGEYRLLGYSRTERYLYVGPADIVLSENSSVIEMQDNKYIVKRCEIYYVKDNPIYVWAILLPCGEKLEDDYESD
jgi:hypothetical protein